MKILSVVYVDLPLMEQKMNSHVFCFLCVCILGHHASKRIGYGATAVGCPRNVVAVVGKWIHIKRQRDLDAPSFDFFFVITIKIYHIILSDTNIWSQASITAVHSRIHLLRQRCGRNKHAEFPVPDKKNLRICSTLFRTLL